MLESGDDAAIAIATVPLEGPSEPRTSASAEDRIQSEPRTSVRAELIEQVTRSPVWRELHHVANWVPVAIEAPGIHDVSQIWLPATQSRVLSLLGLGEFADLDGADDNIVAVVLPCVPGGGPGGAATSWIVAGVGGSDPCGHHTAPPPPRNCPSDIDCDGVPDAFDPDVDGDGQPNGSDPDVDGDGQQNGVDSDVDGDGQPNGTDPDIDGDGQPNGSDADCDGDGLANGSDPDVNGDGLVNGNDPDVDGDSQLNAVDPDMDGDGQPNSSDSDRDGDGQPNSSDPTPDGCQGACCGSHDPCCGSADPCCGVTCDDHDGCTVDTCSNGVCSHQPTDCDDGDECTDDSCAGGACVHVNQCGACCIKLTGDCTQSRADVCNAASHLFLGQGLQCTPNPCCRVETNPPFSPQNASIYSINPVHEFGPCEYGYTDTDIFQLQDVTISAVCDGARWCAVLSGLNGPYYSLARLLPGQNEVRGPGLDTTRSSFCDQGTELNDLGHCPGVWYMLAAVQAHENLHASRLLPALQAVSPQIEASIESVCVPQVAGKTKAQAVSEIRDTSAFVQAVYAARGTWDAAYSLLIANDHYGPAQAVEHAVVDSMVQWICFYAESQCWGTCAVCPAPPMGACCAQGQCSVGSRCDCVARGGNYRGDASTCGPPNPCMGACCAPAPDYTCTVTTIGGCAFDYKGDGTVCSPDPCRPPG